MEYLPAAAHGVVTIHVSGAVAAPGLVVLPTGARVADAIAAAGGAAAGADLGGLNLAASVGDGSRVVVPDVGTAPGGADGGPIRINTATASELEVLPGVGPVLAARIVAHREQRGPFETIEDLLGVPGIGESKLEGLRSEVAVP